MGKSVLICDDSLFMRTMIKNILVRNGYTVAGEAENGAVVVQKYKELSPDLVLMDITMPGVNGLQGLKELEKVDANVKVVMCSAMGQQAMVTEAIQNGAKEFIIKPFQEQQVLAVLERVLG